VTESERREGKLRGTADVAVAFADLVGYTRLGQELAAEDVGRMAGRLARCSTKALRSEVLLVKTIGDAAMFVAPRPAALVATLVDLRAAVEKDPDLPELRVGASFGPATTHGGDWYGATVNLASRIAGAAKPGQILVDEATAGQVPSVPWRKRRRRNLKGVDGRVRLFSFETP
jgi:adenylate cyclase